MSNTEELLFNRAYDLALVTIIYNIIEGLVSILAGYKDDTLTLFGFGVDSFIEVMSGAGIAVMIWRIKRNPGSAISKFEKNSSKNNGPGILPFIPGTFSRNYNKYSYPS
jgi:hypothetical protein